MVKKILGPEPSVLSMPMDAGEERGSGDLILKLLMDSARVPTDAATEPGGSNALRTNDPYRSSHVPSQV